MKKKSDSFFRKLLLILRCIITAVSYAVLWVGIVLCPSALGVIGTVIGALSSLLCIYANIIVPLIRSK